MNCINNETIQKYIDHEIKQDEIVLLEQHIKKCTTCSEKVSLQRDLSKKLKSAIDAVVDDNIEIPAFKPNKGITGETFLRRNRNVFSLSALIAAASLILFILVFRNKKEIGECDPHMFISTHEYEVDANQPVTQQPLLIHIAKPDGSQFDYVMDLSETKQ